MKTRISRSDETRREMSYEDRAFRPQEIEMSEDGNAAADSDSTMNAFINSPEHGKEVRIE